MNTSNPLVSVVIPTYNRARIVTHAIDSALEQTYEDFEIVIVDDGSTDDTRQVIDRYKKDVHYYFKNNGGESSARNFSVTVSKGKYISFLDSDDTWLPQRLGEVVARLEQGDGFAAAITDVEFLDEAGRTIGYSDYRKTWSENSFLFVLSHMLGMFSNMTVSRDAILKIGSFDEDLTTAADFDYFLRIAANYKIALIDKPLLRYQKMTDSLSNKVFSGNRLRVIDKLRKDYPALSQEHSQMLNTTTARIHASYARDLLWLGRTRESRTESLRSIRTKCTTDALWIYLKSFLLERSRSAFTMRRG